ncbi:MAG: EFR1 family ferrodoxin [Eubacteriales bacterium]
MELRINIFYFSGTGFTERVATHLFDEFRTMGHEVNLYYIPTLISEGELSGIYEDCDVFGIMYPVHSFNAPEIVVKFAKDLPKADGKKSFIVKTAGEDAKVNHGSSDLLIRVLKKRGYLVNYEELVQMPSNFAVRNDDDSIRRIVRNADALVKIIAEEIVKGRNKAYKKNVRQRAFVGASRVEWLGAHMIAKFHFKVNTDCNLCEFCIKNCPTKNISIKNDKLKFGTKCTFCMRCIYTCPQKAIHIKRPFSGIEIKDWFDIEELLKDNEKEPEAATKNLT